MERRRNISTFYLQYIFFNRYFSLSNKNRTNVNKSLVQYPVVKPREQPKILSTPWFVAEKIMEKAIIDTWQSYNFLSRSWTKRASFTWTSKIRNWPHFDNRQTESKEMGTLREFLECINNGIDFGNNDGQSLEEDRSDDLIGARCGKPSRRREWSR